MEKVGVIALSSPCRPEIFNDGLSYLRSMGFDPQVALDPTAAYGKSTFLFSSDTPQARAGALEGFFRDPEIKFILSARGAYGSVEVLPHFDFQVALNNSKPLVGFSDTTALLLALSTYAGCVTYHGPSLSSLSTRVNNGAGREDFEKLMEIIDGKSKTPFGNDTLERAGKTGEVVGRLSGGNLTLCASLLGTAWAPKFDDAIFFFEEVGVKPYALHRLLLQLKLSGAFENIKATLVGSLKDCEHSKGLGATARDVIEDVFSDLDVPVFFNAPFGHSQPNRPLPLGVQAKITTDNRLELY